ncbi:MAG TPA: site-specific integrase [Pyrinomonadaceae bacterium]|nr:site-specific integrase [Pyrinomonadaceae bacterium]
MRITKSIFKRGKKGGDTGRIDRTWTLRLIHTNEQGERTSKTWQYATKQDAKDDAEKRKAELVAFVECKGLGLGDIKTFRQWADYAKVHFYRPAVIKSGRKVAGIKAHRQTHILIDHLVACFGDKLLGKFTKFDLDRYKAWRLEQGDLRGKKGNLAPSRRNPVSISTVNRGLAILKHLLIEAHDVELIAKNVTRGSKAIDADAEKARTRILTDAEEIRLLASCSGTRTINYKRGDKTVRANVVADNPYLKAMILLALDSGLRRGEILKLEWQDINFDACMITILGTHTKTQRTRPVPLTRRTKVELWGLPNFGENGRVFPFNDFKRSWSTALRVADIEDLHFHDLRRTFVTRLQIDGISIGIAAELAGHSQLGTTKKYYTSAGSASLIQDTATRINAANEARLERWPESIE